MAETATETLEISGIDALHLRALRKALPEGALCKASAGLTPSQHGDLGTTTAIVVVTALSIKAVAAWLAKNRGQIRVKIKRTKRRADGTAESVEYSVESSSSSSDAEVMQRLLSGLKINPSTLD